MIGSVFASHTLLGYPIVQCLGLVRNEAVTVTIVCGLDLYRCRGLAGRRGLHPDDTAGFSTSAFLVQLLELAIYVPVVLVGLGQAAHYLLVRLHAEEGRSASGHAPDRRRRPSAPKPFIWKALSARSWPASRSTAPLTQLRQGRVAVPGNAPFDPRVLRHDRIPDRCAARPRNHREQPGSVLPAIVATPIAAKWIAGVAT